MSPEKGDLKRFCDFHQDHGHTADECLTLKWQIALLIKKNQLLEFLEKDRDHQREEMRLSTSGSGDKVRIINAIRHN